MNPSDEPTALPELRDIVGPIDRLDLAIPLVLFVGAAVPLAVLVFPESWPLPIRVGSGIGMGVLSWMFPYLNRVLEG